MRRREIFIELTSLLDVILIMLFVLLTQARSQTLAAGEQAEAAAEETAALQAQLLEAEGERDALAEELDALQREQITLTVVEENSLVITLSLQGDAARSIRVEPRDGVTVAIPVDPEDEAYTVNKLRSTLTALMKDAGRENVFVVFPYDRTQIYQAEYLLVGTVVRQLKEEARSAGVALSYIETDIRP